METVKESLHRYIDETPDDQFLDVVQSIFEEHLKKESVWEQLTEQQRNRVFQAENSIENPKRLINHSEMKKLNQKWLK